MTTMSRSRVVILQKKSMVSLRRSTRRLEDDKARNTNLRNRNYRSSCNKSSDDSHSKDASSSSASSEEEGTVDD